MPGTMSCTRNDAHPRGARPVLALLGLLSLAALACAGSESGSDPAGNGGSMSTGNAGAASGGSGGVAQGGSGGSASGSGGAAGSSGGSTTNAGSGGATQGGSGGVEQGGSGGAVAGSGGAGGGGGNAGNSGNEPPGLPDDYTLVFEQSFADASGMDSLLFANGSDWSFVATDGGYAEWSGFSYGPPNYGPHSVAIVKDLKVSSFVLEVEIMQTSMTGGHRDACVFWNMSDASHFYYAHIGQAHDGASHNIHIVNDADRTPITETYTDGFDWGTDEWRRIRVVRDATTGTMEVYGGDDATPMLTASDTTLTDGYVGVGAFDDTGRVRNLRVWAASSSNELAGFFAPLQ